jgi:hypothetical protein
MAVVLISALSTVVADASCRLTDLAENHKLSGD